MGIFIPKTPKFECFLGDDKKKNLDFDMWERQILSAATSHSSAAIKQAMMQSLKGQTLAVTTILDITWEKLLHALKIKYQKKTPYDVLIDQFYRTKMESDEKCASFGTRLEQKLNQVSLQYPNKISDTMYWNCVRERFFHGLSKNMRTNLRTQFDGGANYYKLLELARMIESENFHEDTQRLKPSLPIKRVKLKLVLLPLIIQLNKYSNYKVQSRALLNCYRVIDKIPNHNRFHNLYHNLCKTALILVTGFSEPKPCSLSKW